MVDFIHEWIHAFRPRGRKYTIKDKKEWNGDSPHKILSDDLTRAYSPSFSILILSNSQFKWQFWGFDKIERNEN